MVQYTSSTSDKTRSGYTSMVAASRGMSYHGHMDKSHRPKMGFIVFSALFHIAVLLVVTGQFSFLQKKVDIEEIIVIDMVDAPLSDVTSPPEAKPEEAKKSAPLSDGLKETVKSMAKPILPAPTPPIDKPEPLETEPESAPDVVEEDIVPEPTPIEKAEVPEPKPEPPKPVTRPSVKPTPPAPKVEPKKAEKQPQKEEKADALDFQSVLKNLAGEDAAPSQKNEESDNKPLRRAPVLTQPPPVSEQVSMNEMQALISQLANCWIILPGANNAQDLYVDISLVVNPDRTVRQARVVDRARYQSDSFFKAAADNALRALQSPACSPLNLPPYKYEQWKEMTIRFDPKNMF